MIRALNKILYNRRIKILLYVDYGSVSPSEKLLI